MNIKEFYETIMQRVLTVSDIKHFDLWNEQIMNEENEIPINFPAVFMEIEPINWQQLGMQRQKTDINFNLILVTETLSESNSNETSIERNAALQHLELMQNISAKLQNYSGDDFSSITRRRTVLDTNHGSVIMTINSYQCTLVDTDLEKPTTKRILKLETVIEKTE